jgi:hypothetical protein
MNLFSSDGSSARDEAGREVKKHAQYAVNLDEIHDKNN